MRFDRRRFVDGELLADECELSVNTKRRIKFHNSSSKPKNSLFQSFLPEISSLSCR